MFTKHKNCETHISVALDEPLTSDSCANLVIEFVKYILYQKQQIPFTYDFLAQLEPKVKKADRNASFIKTLLNSLKNVSDHLSAEFLIKGCKVKEIVVIVGATIISPKLHVTLELPTQILNSVNHAECHHPVRKALLNLMKSMTECSEFQEAMTLPLGPTNTFLLLQKSDSNTTSNFFLPKPQYMPLTRTSSSFRIKLYHKDQVRTDCKCENVVRIYRELHESHIEDNCNVPSNCQSREAPYRWYQSKEVIKGFKYIR